MTSRFWTVVGVAAALLAPALDAAAAAKGKAKDAPTAGGATAAAPADKATSLKAKGDFPAAAGNFDDAAVAYRDALLHRAAFTEAREALAMLLARTGRYDEALLEVEEGLKRDPAWKKGLLDEARIEQMAERWPEATMHYRLY
ncbi:MAG TPA: tetratricopeptide repeat protein, partial [Myxococcota bacterium]|nr:tetratricopeptide repeat protein [Myxococcota bacterium]